jgi:hypothetical protein
MCNLFWAWRWNKRGVCPDLRYGILKKATESEIPCFLVFETGCIGPCLTASPSLTADAVTQAGQAGCLPRRPMLRRGFFEDASEGRQHLIYREAASLRSQTRALEGDAEACFGGRSGSVILGE